MKQRRCITVQHSNGEHVIRRGRELSYIANLLAWHHDAQKDFFNNNGNILHGELLTIKRKCTVLILLLSAFIVLNVIMFFILFQTRQHLPHNVHIESVKERNAIPAPTIAMPIAHFDSAMDCSVSVFCFACRTSPVFCRATSSVCCFCAFAWKSSWNSEKRCFASSSFSRSSSIFRPDGFCRIFSVVLRNSVPGKFSHRLSLVIRNNTNFDRMFQ